MFPINPAPDRVIVEPLEGTAKTNSGLHLNSEYGKHTRWGILKAAGTAFRVNAATGEDEIYVLYPSHAGLIFEMSEKSYAIVRVCDILALVGNTEQD